MSARGVAWWAEQQRDVSMSSTTAVHYWSVDSEIGEAECVCASVSILGTTNCIYIQCTRGQFDLTIAPTHKCLPQTHLTTYRHINLLNTQHTMGLGYPEDPNH